MVMSLHAKANHEFDLRALEARTQAIGHELFARAAREHAHLSVLNRWTAQVLSWCLSDPALKANVLRFIDVLPSLRSAREVARHVRDYFPSQFRMPAALRLGSQLARPGLATQGALAAVIRQVVEQVARQFIAEFRPEGAAEVVRVLASRGATCSLDILGEQVLSEAEADRYVSQCETLLRESHRAYAALPPSVALTTCGPRASLSVKPSALTPRFDPISPKSSIERAATRLLPLFRLTREQPVLIYLDMEQYELRDLTLALAKHLLTHPHVDTNRTLGLVIQAYLRDAEPVVDELLAWLAKHQRAVTIRLVKGAYWDHEVAEATQRHWPVPVHEEKAATDLAFERLTRRLLSAHPLVTTAVASHHVRSVAHAMAVAETLGCAKDQLEFQLLYGMGEVLHAAIVSMGYPVRIYTPVGELIPGMAYLVRRILENTANESFLRQEFVQERNTDELLQPPVVSEHAEAVPSAITSDDRWTGEPFADYSKDEARQRMTEALAAVRAQRGRTYPLLIGHDTVETGQTLTVCNPARPAEVLGHVAMAGRAEVDRAVQVASEVQPRWARTPVSERVACLRRLAQGLRQFRHELAAWEVLEVGKPWREADADVVETIDFVEYYSQRMLELAKGPALLQAPGERNELAYVPRGVAVVIAPWNFPGALLTGMACAALVTGNAVIVKPAEQSSITAAYIARLMREAGIPDGVAQFVPGTGEEAGTALVHHPGTHVILFTGSKAVGLSIINACATVAAGGRFIKRVIAEMGGKNAIVVDADADLDAAIQGTLRSAWGYAGQKCSAASRLIVHREVYARFLPRLVAAIDRLVVGDPSDPDTDVGPLIDAAAQYRLTEAIVEAQQSATVAYRYPASRMPTEGYFISPTLVTDVSRQDRLAREELFGPLVCVFRVDSFEEGIALANDTDYALTGGVYSRSPSHLDDAMRAFDVGNLYLNRPITGALVGRQPFGGHRLSGLGTKAGGPDYLLQLVLPKTICTNTPRHGMPLE